MENTTFFGNAASIQENRVLFSIVDADIAAYYAEHGVDKTSLVRNDPDVSGFAASVENALKRGNRSLFRANTLKELAEQTDIHPEELQRTVERYNGYCETGDEEFFKNKEYLVPSKREPSTRQRSSRADMGLSAVSGSMKTVRSLAISNRFRVSARPARMPAICTMTAICSCSRATPWALR